jgi:antitoxin HicB
MKTALYPAKIWKDDGVYYVQFLDVEQGFTFGDTLEEAREMASDVLSALLESALQHNEEIPEPGEHKGEPVYLIAPDARVQAALLLRQARASRSQGEVANAIGITSQGYKEIEEASSDASLTTLQRVAKELGKDLVIELR